MAHFALLPSLILISRKMRVLAKSNVSNMKKFEKNIKKSNRLEIFAYNKKSKS